MIVIKIIFRMCKLILKYIHSIILKNDSEYKIKTLKFKWCLHQKEGVLEIHKKIIKSIIY